MKYWKRLTGKNKQLFYFGISLTSGIVLSLLTLLLVDRNLFFRVIGTIVASLAGGRSAAILAGLEFGLNPVFIIIIVFTINLAWLCSLLPLVILFYYHLTEIKYFGKMLEKTKKRAQSQKSKVAIRGTWGLPLFIWLPFPFTGSFAGAIIGYLLGIPLRRLIIIVIASMFFGIVSWTYGFDYLVFLTGTIGKIITYLIIGGMILHTILRNGASRKKQPKTIVQEQDADF